MHQPALSLSLDLIVKIMRAFDPRFCVLVIVGSLASACGSSGKGANANAGAGGQAASATGGGGPSGGSSVGGASNGTGGATGGSGGATGGTTGGTGTGGTSGAGTRPFDWVGVIGTGQSLSVGWESTAISKTQSFSNLKLIDKGPDPKYPLDGAATAQWSAIPLTEPFRDWVAGAGPGYDDYQYPNDIADNNHVAIGETPQSGMGNTLSLIWKNGGGQGDYVSAHSVVGWSGHCLSDIDKGTRAYSAGISEARVYKKLADAAKKTYGVGAIVLTHGECDATNANYGAGVYQMWQDFDTDLKAITGQSQDVVLLVSQASTVTSGYTGSAVQMWRAGIDHPGKIICTGPKYQIAGGLHLPAAGYERLGEKYAEVFDLVANKHIAWKPLGPNKVTRSGAVITLDFDVPNPPMVWDTHIPAPHQQAHTGWATAHGFEVVDGTGADVAISSAVIQGKSVVLTLAQAPAAGAKLTVGYALTSDVNGYHTLSGQLRDSDPFVGYQNETINVNVTNGSTTISGASGAFLRVAGGDRVSGTGVPNDTVVSKWIFDTQIELSAPWPGASGKATLAFVHDHSNYCVQFAVPVP